MTYSPINIGLIQNKYTDIIIYRKSEHCDNEVDVKLIDKIEITFKNTSTMFETDHVYRFDNTKTAYVIGYDEFEPVICSCYECDKNITFEIDGIEVTGKCTTSITDIDSAVQFLNQLLVDYNADDRAVFYRNGNIIEGKLLDSPYPITMNRYIKIINGSLLEYFKFNKGIYRPNDVNWNAITLTNKDFYFTLYANDIEFFDEFPEGYIDFQIVMCYRNPEELGPTCNHMFTEEWTEFTYKQTEIYRAKLFEYIANHFEEFLKVEERLKTDMELFTQRSIYFDGLYKAFLSSLEVGNKTLAYEILDDIISFKQLNPIQ